MLLTDETVKHRQFIFLCVIGFYYSIFQAVFKPIYRLWSTCRPMPAQETYNMGGHLAILAEILGSDQLLWNRLSPLNYKEKYIFTP